MTPPDLQTRLADAVTRRGGEAFITASCMMPDTGCPYPEPGEDGAKDECPRDCPYFGKEPKPIAENLPWFVDWLRNWGAFVAIVSRGPRWEVTWFREEGPDGGYDWLTYSERAAFRLRREGVPWGKNECPFASEADRETAELLAALDADVKIGVEG